MNLSDLANLSPDVGLINNRPRSIQRPMNQPLTSISSSGNPRNDNSCLEHIRRIRRNLPSQQVSRKISSDENLSAKGGADHYLSNLPSSNINRSKIENYKRIKMEE